MSFYDGFQAIYDEIRTSCISNFVVVNPREKWSKTTTSLHGNPQPEK
jgi:hypothetical protein